MAIFAPLDPRGPDQRRKQLVARLTQQYANARAAAARVPMPPRVGGATLAEGRSFRGASTSRLGGSAHVTQTPNILQSVLARLGVLGHSHAEEMSPGRGLPIAPQARGPQSPIQDTGNAIPTPAQTNAQAATTAGGNGVIGQAPLPGGGSTPIYAPGQAPSTGGILPMPDPNAVVATGDGGANKPIMIPNLPPGYTQDPVTGVITGPNGPLTLGNFAGDPSATPTPSAPSTTLVTLGNGQWYDPVSGQVLGGQDVNPSILPGRNSKPSAI